MEINISSFEFAQNPFQYYADLRRSGSIHKLKHTNSWLVIGYNEILDILTNYELFSSEGTHSFDPVLLNCDPPVHTQNRKILVSEKGLFSPKKIDSLEF